MGINLPSLMVGSEGTLALVTEVTLRTVPIAPRRTCGCSCLSARISRRGGGGGVRGAGESSPAACELYDWRTIHLAREVNTRSIASGWTRAAEAVLVLLFEGDDPDEVSSRAAKLADRISRGGRLAADPVVTTRRADCERMLGHSSPRSGPF